MLERMNGVGGRGNDSEELGVSPGANNRDVMKMQTRNVLQYVMEVDGFLADKLQRCQEAQICEHELKE